jgi:transcription elongation factor GreB
MAGVPRQTRDDDKKPPGKNYITPTGFRKLQIEFEELRFKTRRECVQKLAEAAAEGDRSENAEYIYRKKQLREIDRRIRFLMRRMALAEVIDPRQHSGDRVRFGVVVTLEDESGKRLRYQIVGEDESEPREGKISWSSPLGRALVGKEVGDVATLRVAAGDRELSIEAIEIPGQEATAGSPGEDGGIAAAKAAAVAALAEQADSDDGDDDYDTEDEPPAQRG